MIRKHLLSFNSIRTWRISLLCKIVSILDRWTRLWAHSVWEVISKKASHILSSVIPNLYCCQVVTLTAMAVLIKIPLQVLQRLRLQEGRTEFPQINQADQIMPGIRWKVLILNLSCQRTALYHRQYLHSSIKLLKLPLQIEIKMLALGQSKNRKAKKS